MSQTPNRPTVGLIVPPAAGEVPPEPLALYGAEVNFIAAGLGLRKLTPDGYDEVIDRMGELSRELAGNGADAIVLMGTSLSFYRGPEFNARLIELMSQASGLPATTMSCAVIEALNAVGARRIALATAYVDSVNQRLADFLAASGLCVESLATLDIESVEAIAHVTQDQLLELGRRALTAAGPVDALFMSCGGLRTQEASLQLEAEFGLPVISSAMAGAWAAVRLVGHSGESPGSGRLFAAGPAPDAR